MTGSQGIQRQPRISHQTVTLSRGAHRTLDDGACVVELASLLGGEPFSDRPSSVCPALRSFLHGYNDALPDHLRQDLYGLASDVVGTRSMARVTAWRARLCTGWGSSIAPLVGLSPSFDGPSLANCTEAGIYTAQAAVRVGWCHRQTLEFFRWLANARREPPPRAPHLPVPAAYARPLVSAAR